MVCAQTTISMVELVQFRDCRVLRNGRLVREDLWVRAGCVVNPEEVFFLEKVRADRVVGCGDAIIAPGFIDIQINGGWGVDFSYEIENVTGGVQKVAKNLLAHGVTAFCPTVVTCASDIYHRILPHIARTSGGEHGAAVLGAHLEGPFINVAKKGAHDEKFIRDPDKGMDSVREVYGNIDNVSIVTLAPELPGAQEVVRGLAARGVRVAMGHSLATLDEGERAVKNGASLITHLFNAMLPFHHRDPGLVGLLANEGLSVHYGIIADGIHTHNAALRIAHRTCPQGLVVVSDAVPALGLADGLHHLGSRAVEMRAGRARTAGTETLSGSTAPLDLCVRTLKQATGCSTEYALAAASQHPARALGITHKGTLHFGADADFVMLDDQLRVLSTWIAGKCVYRASS